MNKNATGKGVGKTGFSVNKEIAIQGGQTGGKISRRPRYITVNTPLTSEEMLFMADGVSAILSENKENQTQEEIQTRVTNASHLLMSGKWNLVFSETLPDPLRSLSCWKSYLLRKWKEAYNKIKEDVNMENFTPEDTENLRSLRNVSEAYNAATNTKTKWTREAKLLKD